MPPEPLSDRPPGPQTPPASPSEGRPSEHPEAARPADTARAPRSPLPPGPFDVVVVGAGAAGLWAAGTAAARGRRVLLLEKNRRVGVKVLASGGGHCNLTTTLPVPAVIDAFGREGGRFLAGALRRLPPLELRRRFQELGVPTEEAELEKVWPVSRRAADVVEALVRRAAQAGVRTATEAPCVGVERAEDGFRVRTPRGDLLVPRVLVTVGGRSYPKSGTTGDGYPWLEALGHTITRCVPALAPLVIELPWLRALAGIAEQDARVSVVEGGRTIAERRRPLLCTHTGLSGPGPMDVSRWFELADAAHRPILRVDWLPDVGEERVRADLDAALAARGGERLARCVPGELPARLVESLCAAVGVDPAARASGIPKTARHAVVLALKRLELPVAGTRGFDFAEVTAGGVALPEVDPRTMASRLVPGLFVAGEILDVDGPIGGFNFQAAFATGEAAGLAV